MLALILLTLALVGPSLANTTFYTCPAGYFFDLQHC